MIPLTDASWQSQSWQQLVQSAVTSPAELMRLVGVDAPAANIDRFPLFAPIPFIRKIRAGDPSDPLLLQVLPQPDELMPAEGYTSDPLDECNQSPVPGLLAKYEGRVLVTVSGTCAIHCRYCFRRDYPYDARVPDSRRWEAILAFIRGDRSIREVILSGGEPLMLKDSRLAEIGAQLARIAHVDRIRIHTRMPIVIPQRVTRELLDWVAKSPKQTVIVLHVNHPNEVDAFLAEHLHRLRSAGAFLLNQSVLLRGINAFADTLRELSEALFAMGVMPYYLHMPDKVRGTAHFDVSEAEAKHLHRELAAMLPGYLLPRLVREIPGERAKTPLDGRWDGSGRSRV